MIIREDSRQTMINLRAVAWSTVGFCALSLTARLAIRRSRERSKQQLALRATKLREQFLERVLSTTPGLVYEYRLADDRILYCNEGLATTLGYEMNTLCRLDSPVAQLVHPADHARISDYKNNLLRAVKGGVVELTCRILHRDGGWRWLAFRSTVFSRSAKGTPLRAVGVAVDVTARHLAEAAHQASEERFDAFMGCNPAVAFIKDPQGRFLYVNDTCARTFGRTVEDFLGRTDFDLFPAEVAAEFRRMDDEIFRSGQPRQFEEEVPGQRGELRHLLTMKFPFGKSPEGRLLGGTALEITDRKLAECTLERSLLEKDALLREVHHRVKNNLQTVVGLLSMQTEFAVLEAAPALDACQRRIQCLILIHEQFENNDGMSQVDFSQYVTAMVGELAGEQSVETGRVRILLQTEAAPMSVDIAIPFGLILNELATNAVRHAFPGESCGEVLLAVSTDPAGRLVMVVRDNGVGVPPTVDWEASPTLGFRIVRILADQIDAVVSVQPTAGGGSTFQLLLEPYKDRK